MTTEVAFAGPPAGSEVRVRVAAGGPRPLIRGRIVDSGGRGVAGIRVAIETPPARTPQATTRPQSDFSATGAEGEFAIRPDVGVEELAGASIRVVEDVRPIGIARDVVVLTLAASLRTEDGYDLGALVRDLGSVVTRGVVVDEDGRPLAGVVVGLTGDDSEPPPAAETDASGRSELVSAEPVTGCGFHATKYGRVLDAPLAVIGPAAELRLVVYAPENLRLNPVEADGVQSISFAEALQDTASTRDGRFGPAREVLAYAYTQAPVDLNLAVERRKPDVTVRQLLTARVESGVIKYEATFFYDVRYSSVKTLRLDVPAALVTGKQLRNLTPAVASEKPLDPQPDDVQKEGPNATIALELTRKGEAEFLGDVTIKFEWDKKIGDLPVGKPFEETPGRFCLRYNRIRYSFFERTNPLFMSALPIPLPEILAHIHYLSAIIGGRGSCTPAEYQASEYVLNQMQQMGMHETNLESFNGVAATYKPYALAFIAALQRTIIVWLVKERWASAIGAFFCGIGALGMNFESDFKSNWMRWLRPKSESQNAVGVIPARNQPLQHLVLCAHMYSHRTPIFYSSPIWQQAFGALVGGAFISINHQSSSPVLKS